MPELMLPKQGEKYLSKDGQTLIWLCYEKAYGFTGYYRGMANRSPRLRKVDNFADWQDTRAYDRDGRSFDNYVPRTSDIMLQEPQGEPGWTLATAGDVTELRFLSYEFENFPVNSL